MLKLTIGKIAPTGMSGFHITLLFVGRRTVFIKFDNHNVAEKFINALDKYNKSKKVYVKGEDGGVDKYIVDKDMHRRDYPSSSHFSWPTAAGSKGLRKALLYEYQITYYSDTGTYEVDVEEG